MTECPICAAYLAHRRTALLRPLGRLVTRHGVRPAGVVERLLERVHARHLAGHPIHGHTPRPASSPARLARKRSAA